MIKGLKVVIVVFVAGWMFACSSAQHSNRNVPVVNGVVHIVQKGDTINAIAKTYEVSPQLLVRRNNLREGDTLVPGTRLFVPGATEVRVVKVKETDSLIREERDGLLHKVGQGETLIAIANTYNVSLDELQRANNLPDPSKIYLNQELWIPRAKEVKDVDVPKAVVLSGDPVKQEKKPSRIGSKSKVSSSPESKNTAQAAIQSSTASSETKANSQSVESATADQPPVDFPRKVKEFGSVKFQWPLKESFKFLRGFSKTAGNLNPGIDLGANIGTDVCAAADGETLMAGGVTDTLGMRLGNYIIIYHGDHNKKEIYSLYAHNSQNLVKVGDKVKRGQPIAKVGKTGRMNEEIEGGILHFEVREQTDSIDPLTVLPPLN